MNNVKISLANVQGKLSRMEMKQVLGGLVPEDDEGGQCSGNCKYLPDPNSTIFAIGDCVANTNPMQTGCACKRHDNILQPGCQ